MFMVLHIFKDIPTIQFDTYSKFQNFNDFTYNLHTFEHYQLKIKKILWQDLSNSWSLPIYKSLLTCSYNLYPTWHYSDSISAKKCY